MIKFTEYLPHDMGRIDFQPMQAAWRDQLLTPGYAESLTGRAWTARDGTRVVGCGGFSEQWKGRSVAWAVLGRNVPKRGWPRICAKVKAEIQKELDRHVAACGHGRVEITVPQNFAQGCRLAKVLGFEVEAIVKKYAPDGADHFLFAKVA